MTLGADDDVGALAVHDVEEARNAFWQEVEVGVEQKDVGAPAEIEAAADGVSLATVFVENEWSDRLRRFVRDGAKRLGRTVAAAVVYDDDFKGNLTGQKVPDAADIVGDGAGETIRRHHHAQQSGGAEALPRCIKRVA